MEIRIYTPEHKSQWDSFVQSSKNGTFLFYRDFMEYHADRFRDYSLMFFDGRELLGLMPGHIKDKIYYTHQGLTYGGLIMGDKTTANDVLSIFEYLTVTLRQQGIKQIIYKAVPHIYHKMPAEEDLYALFRYNGVLKERCIASAICQDNKLEFSRLRRRQIQKASEADLLMREMESFGQFWDTLTDNLQKRYHVNPVHTLSEIEYLKEKFPTEIRLFCVFDKEEMVSGCLMFETDTVAHAQYSSATLYGKEVGAMDFLYNDLINVVFHDKKYFDYGISTEKQGLYLNENLIHQKEGFGARGVVYDTYSIDL